MPSTFFGLNIATSGMNAYNMGLNTTAHNISNRNTKGYSKQSVEQKAGIPLSLRTSYGMLICRIFRDIFIQRMQSPAVLPMHWMISLRP